MSILKVAIATASDEKIKGIVTAFCREFQLKESQIDVFCTPTASEVSNQPFDAETYLGAQNRIDNIKSLKDGVDYYVSCEAGIESFLGQYFNVQVVCIFETKTQRYLFAKSAGWQIPSIDIEIIKNSDLDSYLRGKGIQRLEDLLGESYPRSKMVSQATELALASKRLL